MKPLKYYKTQYQSYDGSYDLPILPELLKDHRKNIQEFAQLLTRKRTQYKALETRFADMNQYEVQYKNRGFSFCAGIDEVGRGCLAGPMVIGCVILDSETVILGLDDSKKLSKKKIEKLANEISEKAIYAETFFYTQGEIDRFGISKGLQKAVSFFEHDIQDTIEVDTTSLCFLVDYFSVNSTFEVCSITQGDAHSNSIAAASILAKYTRDVYMKRQAEKYPEYGFEKHVGYGTKHHCLMLKTYGATPLHRMSFIEKIIALS